MGTLVVVALVAVAAAAVVARPDAEPGPDDRTTIRVEPSGGTALLEPRGGVGDIVAVVEDPQHDLLAPWRTLARVSLDGRIVWRRAVADPGAIEVVAAERGIVVLLDISTVSYIGLDSDDGAELWRVPASEAPAGARVVGDRLVVPGDDGAVAGHDLQTGEEVWALDDPENTSTAPPAISVVDDDTVLVTRSRERFGVELVAVAVDDGSEGPAYAPECPRAAGTDPERASAYATVRVVPGTSDAVIVFGSVSQCIQRWSTTAGSAIWSTTTVEDSGANEDLVVPPRSVVLDEGHVAFDGADGVVVTDLADGATRVLPTEDVAPVFVVDGSVVAADVDDDGARPVLTGLAVDGGEPRWADVELPGIGGPAAFVGPARSGITPDTPVVVAGRDEALIRTVEVEDGRRARITSVDPATGATTDAVVALRGEPDDVPGGAVASVEILDGGRALVVISGVPHLLDLASGEVVASWAAGG